MAAVLAMSLINFVLTCCACQARPEGTATVISAAPIIVMYEAAFAFEYVTVGQRNPGGRTGQKAFTPHLPGGITGERAQLYRNCMKLRLRICRHRSFSRRSLPRTGRISPDNKENRKNNQNSQ
jgi:hypothetical protein